MAAAILFFGLMFLVVERVTGGTLEASTFLGGSSNDGLMETPMVRDADGNIFVAGRTKSSNFPVITGCVDTDGHNGGVNDIFVSKFSADLKTLLASTYLGGSGEDALWPGVALAIDADGSVFVATSSNSTDLAANYGAPSGGYDIYIARLDNDLQTIQASRLLGGSAGEYFVQLVVDDDGTLIVSGTTGSGASFPTTPGVLQSSYAGDAGGPYPGDLFVCRFTNDLSTLQASTLVGGEANEYAEALLVDQAGNICLAGWTSSAAYPTSVTAYRRVHQGGYYDSFVTKLSPDLTALAGSTLIGGSAWDFAYELVEGVDGSMYITGHTASNNHPTTPGAFDRGYNGSVPSVPGTDDDVFVARLSGSLDALMSATFLGAPGFDHGLYLQFFGTDHVLVAGSTRSTSGFPVSPSGYDPSHNGNSDFFVVMLTNNLTALKTGTFLGGSQHDIPCGLAIDAGRNICLSGITNSSNYPRVGDCYDTTFNGAGESWVEGDYGGDAVVTILPSGYFVDTDGDGFLDIDDNCPSMANPSQGDDDFDGRGNACDNCWTVANSDQADGDADCPAMPYASNPACGDVCQNCCTGKIGDANGSGDDLPTIGDISVMIDARFITGECITEGAGANIRCLAEADANVSGGANPTCEDISIGDISVLIDCLFITGEPPFVRTDCAR